MMSFFSRICSSMGGTQTSYTIYPTQIYEFRRFVKLTHGTQISLKKYLFLLFYPFNHLLGRALSAKLIIFPAQPPILCFFLTSVVWRRKVGKLEFTTNIASTALPKTHCFCSAILQCLSFQSQRMQSCLCVGLNRVLCSETCTCTCSFIQTTTIDWLFNY